MKNSIILLLALAICIAFSGCNKNDSGTNPTDSNQPLVTLVGSPTGIAVTASIDAGGGTLTSADGMFQLTVPAGAVSAATVFSIQPVSNQCPGGFGMSYRLLPEGITFAQPVTLNFSYADTLLANEKYLAIAYQGLDKTWFAPKVVSLNVAGNQISVQTKHFSDWSLYQKMAIAPSNTTVKINESLDLEVIYVGEPKDTTDEGIELSNLNINKTYVSTWQVNGTSGNDASGHIVKQGENKATYSAPSVVPDQNHNPVAVSATLSNVSFTLNGETFKNPKVIANIMVIDKGVLFSVVFTSSRPLQPVGNKCFTETDSASMSVLLQDDDSMMVFNLYNEDAKVTPKSLSDGGCTYTVTKPGDGFFNFSPGVSFFGVYSPTEHLISVGINGTSFSKGYTPSFQKSCTGGSNETIPGNEQATLPTQFSFDANKDYQEFVETIPGGGVVPDGFIKTAITKVK